MMTKSRSESKHNNMVMVYVMIVLLAGIVTSAIAEDAGIITITIPEVHIVTSDKGETGLELAAGYINKMMTGAVPTKRGFAGMSSLEGNDLRLYNALKPMIVEVAEGTRSSAMFDIQPVDLYEQTYYSYTELGGVLDSEEVLDYEVLQSAFEQKIIIDLNKVMDALLVDCPYELYWYDKSQGVTMFQPELFVSYNTEGDDYIVPYFYVSQEPVVVTFAVAAEYSLTGETSTSDIDTSWGVSIQNAAANAQSIVSANAGKSDIAKLTAYKDAICGLVEYHSVAAEGGMAYGNPWQMIWVFDGDPDTKVVCEGYAKAFQFLCDESSFDGNVRSIIVSGLMQGGTGAGGHMWNIVTLNNGRKVLADITNSDTGTVGAGGELFLVGYTSKEDTENGTVYGYEANGMTVLYRYEQDIVDLYW